MKLNALALISGLALAAASSAAYAQGAPAAPAAPAAPPAPMTFFVTSVGKGDGANLGGLAGADAHCKTLATAVGRGDADWRAYLSTQGPGAVNARDRIGSGPWHNAKGQLVGKDVASIHGDTLEQARGGVIFGKVFSLNEKGEQVKAAGDTPNQHDILTGSTTDGRAIASADDRTCSNWTSNADGKGSAMVGHSDKQGGGGGSWNSQHPSRGCSQPNLVATGGAGLFYCFAAK